MRALTLAGVGVALALFSGVEAAVGSLPALDDYDYDGMTTYCYWMSQGMNITNLDFSYVKVSAKGNGCPVTMTLTQNTAGPIIRPQQNVEYQFTAKLNFDDNKFGMKSLDATVLDPYTHIPVQIGHANIHTCSRTTVCDIFRNGANRLISDQETSNFTDDSATFTQRIAFPAEGEYNVFAHIVLPPKDAGSESYHFLTFMTTTIQTKVGGSTGSTTDGSSSGMSTGAIVGIIVGIVVLIIVLVVSIVFYRRKRTRRDDENDHFRHSGYMPSRTQKSKNSHLDWNANPNFQQSNQGSMMSEFRQPQGSRSAYSDHRSGGPSMKQSKTISSSGSSRYNTASPRTNSSYRGYPPANSPGGMSSIKLPDHHGVDTYDTYYNHDTSYDLHGNQIQSFQSDTSIGTSKGFRPPPPPVYSNDRGYGGGAQPSGFDYMQQYSNHPAHNSGYGRDDAASAYGYGFERSRAGTDETLEPLPALRDSDMSMGTVHFGGDAPADSPKGEYRPTDRSLTSTEYEAQDPGGFEYTARTMDFMDSTQSFDYRPTHQQMTDFRPTNGSEYTASYRGTDTYVISDKDHQRPKRVASAADSESYEF
ncbi:hypothetical protein Poli38472_005394 [Pythium oligandrum]|uniref:Uncharacterized protein n=1 Tax=Pythium oligandrum TaxID=41045 RepID=A0A8K1FHI8_PYTOL|nr:hypothetical protein Poli38472_005394 [Pythium oligandrum]|eukprot:TMW62776.1 hypothetical protein Poli38472_005394 [Pythium oligandrum]